MLCDSFIKNLASLGSPGMNEIRWLKPLFPDQKIYGKVTIIKKTPSKSKPNIGSMITKSEVYNEKKELSEYDKINIKKIKKGYYILKNTELRNMYDNIIRKNKIISDKLSNNNNKELNRKTDKIFGIKNTDRAVGTRISYQLYKI